MGTIAHIQDLSATLFGKTRRGILALLYGRPEKAYYLREIARLLGAGLGAVQRELRRLAQVAIVTRRVHGRQVYYEANRQCPIFEELRRLTVKTAGAADVVCAALRPLAERIRVAFIHGSFASGAPGPGSDIDLVIIGAVQFAEVISALRDAQQILGREINPVVYPVSEFRQKLAGGHHFVQTVWRAKKLFVAGDARELARLAEKRLAGRPQNQQARDHGLARRRRP